MPSFTIEGETQVNTVPGGFLSVMILGIALCYALLGFIDLYEGNDPNIRQNAPETYSPADRLSFTDDLNFRLAVGTRHIENTDDLTLEYNP